MKLTAAHVKSLKAVGGRRTTYKDSVREGLQLRVSPSGACSWSVVYSYRGKDRRITLGTTKRVSLAKARARAKEVLALVALGRDPAAELQAEKRAPPRDPVTVADLARESLAHLTLRPKTRAGMEQVTEKDILPALGKRLAAELTRRDIREWSERIAARAPGVANRAFNILRRYFSLGIERDLIIATPFGHVKQPTPDASSDRVLTAEELWALLRALEQLTKGAGSDMVRLLLLTGTRRSMVVGARRAELEDLDGRDPRWIIPAERMKNAKPHVVPLSRGAAELVKERLDLAGPDCGFLFPAIDGRSERDWNPSFPAVLKRRMEKILGEPIPNWTVHNLRQTTATWLRERLGVRRDIVSLILSHTITEGPAVTSVYDRAQLLPERRDALQRWDDLLVALPAPGTNVLPFSAGVGQGSE